jgi:hypothetical protein
LSLSIVTVNSGSYHLLYNNHTLTKSSFSSDSITLYTKAHSMARSVEIPQDIIDSIIAVVGDDARLLKQCSLVSSSFLLPCRKQLFSRITLRNDETCKGIHEFLVQNPVIQSFVRAITLNQGVYIRKVRGNPLPQSGTRLCAWVLVRLTHYFSVLPPHFRPGVDDIILYHENPLVEVLSTVACQGTLSSCPIVILYYFD